MSVEKALPKYLKEMRPRFKRNRELLERNTKEAFKILESCELCERRCKVNRLKEERGFCKATDTMIVSSMFEHYGEERFLIPSFTIFFIGCTFSCEFCQNWTISQRIEKGEEITEEELAKVIDKHTDCRNVNFVGGDPTPYLPFILKTLSFVKSDIPVVWNSNFYMSEKSMKLLKGLVDVYLSDWKYWSDECAKRLSKVDNYLEVVKRNHLLTFKDSELVIRHLVLPNHFDCCTKPFLDFVAENFKDKAVVNLMDQYRPEFRASNHKDISRHLKDEEFNKVVDYAEKLGINYVT